MTREELDRLIEDRRVFAHYSDAEKRLARLLRAALAVVDLTPKIPNSFDIACDPDVFLLFEAKRAFDAALSRESA